MADSWASWSWASYNRGYGAEVPGGTAGLQEQVQPPGWLWPPWDPVEKCLGSPGQEGAGGSSQRACPRQFRSCH